jgi:hypothetical protein
MHRLFASPPAAVLAALTLSLGALPGAVAAQSTGAVVEDFTEETVGTPPVSFSTPIGFWSIGTDGVDTKPVLFEDGTQWEGSSTANNLATQAQALYGDRWRQFTDELPGTSYFPIAVFNKVPNFTQGTVVTRFAIVGGDIDTEAGILFNYQPNGDFMALRMDADESSLKLYQWTQGQQNALRIAENVPASLARWHELQLTVAAGGTHLAASLDGQQFLDADLASPISGQVGAWSKTDSVVVFNTFSVDANAP